LTLNIKITTGGNVICLNSRTPIRQCAENGFYLPLHVFMIVAFGYSSATFLSLGNFFLTRLLDPALQSPLLLKCTTCLPFPFEMLKTTMRARTLMPNGNWTPQTTRMTQCDAMCATLRVVCLEMICFFVTGQIATMLYIWHA